MSFSIRPSEQQHHASIIKLASQCFGEGYIDHRWFSENHMLSLVALPQNDSATVCGFLFGTLDNKTRDNKTRDNKTAELKTICVDPDYSRAGIATRLGNTFIEICISKKVSQLRSPAWTNGDQVPVDPLLRKLGFTPEHTQADYWLADSQRRKYKCITCGYPCHCTAIIYSRLLDSGQQA